MQKRKEMSKIYQKILQKYLKISDFCGKPAPKITWRKGAGCTPLVKRQKLTFPEIPEITKLPQKFAFRDKFWKIPKDYSDQNNELLEYGSANSASVIQCLGIFTV